MTNEQWLSVFREIGATMRKELPSIIGMEGGLIPLGRGAGGDKTFPVDKWAEDIVVTTLDRVYVSGESFTLISEEMGIKKFGEGEKTVLVDPIDGSNNAKNGIPFFSVSLALLDGDTLADLSVGYVINLAVGDEFWAIRGGGAFKNGKRMHTSSNDEFIVMAFEASSPKAHLPRIMPLLLSASRARAFGSIALDLAYLASGALNIVAVANSARPFDFAAGMLILKEAGGVITGIDGGALDAVAAGIERTVPLLACADRNLHGRALSLLTEKKNIPAQY